MSLSGKVKLSIFATESTNAPTYIRKVTCQISPAAPSILDSLFADDATIQQYIAWATEKPVK
jgi:hypothetical protein